MPSKQAIADIIWAYRKQQGRNNGPITLRQLSKMLSALLSPIDGHISHQSLSNWENQVHAPSSLSIIQMMQIAKHHGEDWRGDFAQDLLAVLKPRRFLPATPIGKKVVRQLKKRTGNQKASNTPPPQAPHSPGTGS